MKLKLEFEMRTLFEFVVFGVVGAGFVAATVNEMNVNGKTDYSLLLKTNSFWLLLLELLIIFAYIMIKRFIRSKVILMKDEIVSELHTTLLNKFDSEFKRSIGEEVIKSINSMNMKQIKQCKIDLKNAVDNRIDYYAEKRLVPLIYTEVNKEIDKSKKELEDVKLQVAVLKEIKGNQKLDQNSYTVAELDLALKRFAATIVSGS